jgi:hypothetical protein
MDGERNGSKRWMGVSIRFVVVGIVDQHFDVSTSPFEV